MLLPRGSRDRRRYGALTSVTAASAAAAAADAADAGGLVRRILAGNQRAQCASIDCDESTSRPVA